MAIAQTIIDQARVGEILKDNPNGGFGDDYITKVYLIEENGKNVLWKPSNDTVDTSSSCHQIGIPCERGELVYYKKCASLTGETTIVLPVAMEILRVGFVSTRPTTTDIKFKVHSGFGNRPIAYDATNSGAEMIYTYPANTVLQVKTFSTVPTCYMPRVMFLPYSGFTGIDYDLYYYVIAKPWPDKKVVFPYNTSTSLSSQGLHFIPRVDGVTYVSAKITGNGYNSVVLSNISTAPQTGQSSDLWSDGNINVTTQGFEIPSQSADPYCPYILDRIDVTFPTLTSHVLEFQYGQ